MLRKFLKTILGVVGVIVMVLVILRLTPWWDQALPPGPLMNPDFAALIPPPTPNWYLVCPPAKCPRAHAHRESPVYKVGPGVLREFLMAMIQTVPEVSLVQETPTQLYLIARTPLIRWPDHVVIEIVGLDEASSTLIIYSRSQYGRSDYGTNKSRVENWLARLEKLLPRPPG